MASKKNIIHRMTELENKLKELKKDIDEHYNKDVEFKSDFCDVRVLIEEGWSSIFQQGDHISLGIYPNARWEQIEKALEYVKEEYVKGIEEKERKLGNFG